MSQIQRYDLLVMRLAEMKRVHPQMDSTQFCSRCLEPVGIYPSGLAVIAKFGRERVAIVCSHCRTPAQKLVLAPGAETEHLQSVRNPDLE